MIGHKTESIPRFILVAVLSGNFILPAFSQENESRQEDPNAAIFMTYLRNNWDDIHDVIMRFHYEEPKLKGMVFIEMDWRNGSLYSASVDGNTTGNPALGQALIESMKKWNIPDLAERWIITIPFKTEIVGSDDLEFNKTGIFTGKVLDDAGIPIAHAKLNLLSKDISNTTPVSFLTNREGIFIKTLIPTGKWQLECSKDGYKTSTIDNISFGMGEHTKKSIVLKK